MTINLLRFVKELQNGLLTVDTMFNDEGEKLRFQLGIRIEWTLARQRFQSRVIISGSLSVVQISGIHWRRAGARDMSGSWSNAKRTLLWAGLNLVTVGWMCSSRARTTA